MKNYKVHLIIILLSSLISSALVYVNIRSLKNEVAKSIFNSIENNLLIKDLREVQISLGKNDVSGFAYIVYLDKDDKVIFEIKNDSSFPSKNMGLNYFSFSLLDDTKILFYYNISSYYLSFFLFSLILSVVNLLLFNFISSKNIKILKLSQKVEMTNAIYELSKKLAHDIRSPISTLNLISTKIENNDIKELQLAVVSQINSIANDLLENGKLITSQNKNHSIVELLKLIEDESSIKNRSKIITVSNKLIKNMSINKLEFTTLYNCLNNFIQNSIEAHSSNVKIELSLNNFNQMTLKIEDNGNGIPEDILNVVGKEQVTYGKENSQSGNGIALYNAIKDLQKIRYSFDISSQQNIGTKIVITKLSLNLE